MSLEALRITECPLAFASFAEKHNALVDLLSQIRGQNGITVAISERNGIITGSSGLTEAQVYDIAYSAAQDLVMSGAVDAYIAALAPVQSVAGRTGAVTIAAADLADFDTAAVAAVLPITSVDVTDFATAAATAAPVQSVAGRTGTVVITSADLADFATAAAAAAPVQSVAGDIGNVTLAWADLTDVTQETIEVCNLGNVNFLTS